MDTLLGYDQANWRLWETAKAAWGARNQLLRTRGHVQLYMKYERLDIFFLYKKCASTYVLLSNWYKRTIDTTRPRVQGKDPETCANSCDYGLDIYLPVESLIQMWTVNNPKLFNNFFFWFNKINLPIKVQWNQTKIAMPTFRFTASNAP